MPQGLCNPPSSEERKGRKKLAPVEYDALKFRHVSSSSEKLGRTKLAPAEKKAVNLTKTEYTSPLEKWKKRLSPADSAAIVSEEICLEYFRLSGTNPTSSHPAVRR